DRTQATKFEQKGNLADAINSLESAISKCNPQKDKTLIADIKTDLDFIKFLHGYSFAKQALLWAKAYTLKKVSKNSITKSTKQLEDAIANTRLSSFSLGKNIKAEG